MGKVSYESCWFAPIDEVERAQVVGLGVWVLVEGAK
jgi:hypothetical protein